MDTRKIIHEFCEQVDASRQEKKLKVSHIAVTTGLSDRCVSNVLSGKATGMRADTMLKTAISCGVSLDKLMNAARDEKEE